jgi:exonuclease III
MQMEHDWGIILLADTRIHDLCEVPFLNRMWKCKEGFWSKGTPNVGGTAILFYKHVVVQSSYHDAGGRWSRVDYLWKGESFFAISIYAPANASERKAFFADHLLPHLQKYPPSERCFIGGDFNFVKNPILDRSSTSSRGVAGLTEWSKISDCFSLTDVFRNFHPKKSPIHFLFSCS